MGNLRTIIERYHLERWFQRDNLIILVLAGILLVVIGMPVEKTGEEKKESKTVQESVQEVVQETERQDSAYAYVEYLEEKLEEILKEMQGVGRVQVMITLETSEELIVEKDEPMTRNNTTERDAAGGDRSVYQMENGQETVYAKQDGQELPYVTKTILPKISGVLIVAEGAGIGTVTNNISRIAQTLFDIEAHKVQVVPMGE